MATIDSRESIDRMIADNGETYCKSDGEPPVMRIVEYQNAHGGVCWGVVWHNEPGTSKDKYLQASEYVRNPRVIWERPDLLATHNEPGEPYVTKTNTPILDSWNGFRAMVLPKDASEAQVADMKKAFFGGAGVMFEIMSMVSGALTEDAAVRVMDALHREIHDFGRAQLDPLIKKEKK